MSARWRVVSDEPKTGLARNGEFEERREITFELLDSGSTGRIEVALRNYTPEYVSSEIQRYADNIAAVANLRAG